MYECLNSSFYHVSEKIIYFEITRTEKFQSQRKSEQSLHAYTYTQYIDRYQSTTSNLGRPREYRRDDETNIHCVSPNDLNKPFDFPATFNVWLFRVFLNTNAETLILVPACQPSAKASSLTQCDRPASSCENSSGADCQRNFTPRIFLWSKDNFSRTKIGGDKLNELKGETARRRKWATEKWTTIWEYLWKNILKEAIALRHFTLRNVKKKLRKYVTTLTTLTTYSYKYHAVMTPQS